MPRLSLILSMLCLSLALASSLSSVRAAGVTADKTPEGVKIQVDGQPFADYLIKSGSKPIVWPIIGPTGKKMTRSWPMDPSVESEKDRDHIHQRSLWFTHGDVNGVDFWTENKGQIVHKEFVNVEGGPEAVVVTRNDWVAPDGKLVCQDERTLKFGANADQRWIDFAIEIKATEGPVTFGDTKEGSFGVRVPSSMRVESKQGGKLINSDGRFNLAAWGKPAPWVDYFGPVEGETLGVAIMNHPSSYGFPSHWHVRTYGLFAANPFGLKDFTAGAKKGEFTLPKGDSLKLRYRVLLHKGDEKQGAVAEAYADFAK